MYAGENLRVKRTVAIKILHAAASAIAEMADRFEREAQAAGQIGNDHITEVYDLGTTASGERYMVLEYLEGETLRGRIKRLKRLEPQIAVMLLVQVLEGLGAAHRAGIVHRDVKPDNIFVLKEKAGRKDFVKVLDFGISKFTQQVGEGSATRTGTVMGSPNYMSPEHVRGTHEVDPRSDLYSVGILLYECLTGSVPRSAKNFAELLFKIAYEPLPDPRTVVPGISDELVAVLMKACATDPTARYQDAQEFSEALQLAVPFSDMGTESSLRMTGGHAAASWGSGSQPSFGSRSQPGFGAGSQPSFSGIPAPAPSRPRDAGAVPSLSASSPSWQSVSGKDAAGSQPDANGTAILALDASGSLPAFGPPSASPGSTSQPSFGPHPSSGFGASSQPGFGPPPVSQQTFGSSSQPAFGSSSQPTFTQPGLATALPATATVATSPRRGPLALAIGLGLVVGLGGLAAFVLIGVKSAPSSSAMAQSTSATATEDKATSSPAAPKSEPTATVATTASADTSSAASSTAQASATTAPAVQSSAPAVAKPVIIKKKAPDPGY